MKVVITEISSPYDRIMSLGLITFLNGIGIPCDDEDPVAAKQPAPPVVAQPAGAPAKKVAGKKAKSAPKAAPAPADAPRVTIRQRILNTLGDGPKTTREILAALNDSGVNSTHELLSQHMYLIKRDGLATRDDETNIWSIA